MYVVHEKGSGTGNLCCWRMYCPVLRCHHVSVSPDSALKSETSSSAPSAKMTGRSHAGAGIESFDGSLTIGALGCTGAVRALVRGGMRLENPILPSPADAVLPPNTAPVVFAAARADVIIHPI